AAGLLQDGAEVTMVNRGVERGRRAAELLGVPFLPLADFTADGYSLLVHATPVTDALPFPLDGLCAGAVILELPYRPGDTPLIAAARSRGHLAIDGREMMLVEMHRQFHLMTGRQLPSAEVRAALGDGHR
ncbi:MAG: shikimate dehydrogenase family protein, partial [Carbonactinosporaceae bacterium]